MNVMQGGPLRFLAIMLVALAGAGCSAAPDEPGGNPPTPAPGRLVASGPRRAR